MEKEFIPYNEALALKELGFDEPCLDYFTNGIQQNSWSISYNSDDKNRDFESISRPTFSQSFKFFREKYDLICKISSLEFAKGGYVFEIHNISKSGLLYSTIKEFTPHLNNYEEAELECLKKLIEIVKNK